MIGRLLCFLGWHRWEARSESDGRVILTFNRCVRESCPRYSTELLVDVDVRRRSFCRCHRHGWHPECPVHGLERKRVVA